MGVVLAGGASRRMGTDKALLTTPTGETLLQLAVRHLHEAGATHVVIASGPSARYDTTTNTNTATTSQVPDPPGHVGDGPLAGLAAAFAHLAATHRDPIALVLAVDLPDADTALLRDLAERLRAESGRAAAVIPLDPTGRPQPLHAAYAVDPARRAIDDALQRGERRLLPVVLDALHATTTAPDDAGAAWHRNVNAPDDLWPTPPPVG